MKIDARVVPFNDSFRESRLNAVFVSQWSPGGSQMPGPSSDVYEPIGLDRPLPLSRSRYLPWYGDDKKALDSNHVPLNQSVISV